MNHPPLTPEERERLRDDFSAPAVERYAAHLLSRWPVDDAVICAQKYRDACPSSNDPRRAFWSRVIARILATVEDPAIEMWDAATESGTGGIEPGAPFPLMSSTSAEPAPRAADVVPSPITEGQDAPAVRDIASLECDVIRDSSGAVSGFSAPRWHDEDSRRPNAKPKASPKQGSLF